MTMAVRYRVAVFNAISPRGLERFPAEIYSVGKGVAEPDAILLRSHVLEEREIAASVKAVGRAGTGVNNIPVAALSKRGVSLRSLEIGKLEPTGLGMVKQTLTLQQGIPVLHPGLDALSLLLEATGRHLREIEVPPGVRQFVERLVAQPEH